MNTDWFKTHLRRAGKTTNDLADAIGRDRAVASRILNGKQKITYDQANAFANVLDVPLVAVLTESGLDVPENLERQFIGVGIAGPSPVITVGTQQKINRIAGIFGGGRPEVSVWMAGYEGLKSAGIIAGDFLLVDTSNVSNIKSGDVVIANIHNVAKDDAQTVIRQYAPPVLIGENDQHGNPSVNVVDGTNVTIHGRVTATWREYL